LFCFWVKNKKNIQRIKKKVNQFFFVFWLNYFHKTLTFFYVLFFRKLLKVFFLLILDVVYSRVCIYNNPTERMSEFNLETILLNFFTLHEPLNSQKSNKKFQNNMKFLFSWRLLVFFICILFLARRK
jgi:hypothetical protein